MDDPPDTPAPLFAVRAFKTAIFGTPHPYSTTDSASTQRTSEGKVSGALEFGHRTIPGSENKYNVAAQPKLEAFQSPTKGILLTPGTGAARRKSVSFGALVSKRQNNGTEQAQRTGGTRVSLEDIPNALLTDEPRAKGGRSASLSRTLFASKIEASDQPHDANLEVVRPALSLQETHNLDLKKAESQNYLGVECTEGDITIDLDTPRSKSGKHWKAEYERYSKRSDREMKKVIQLSQTAKSYAAKKDVEAANLGEILSEELSRTAVMEAKVSAVASQLAKHAAQGLGGNPDEQKLVSDLAKQTALALRYKHKADRCRTALNRQSRFTAVSHDADSIVIESTESTNIYNEAANNKILTHNAQDWSSLQGNLHEMKAAGLEKENFVLKANLVRVKEEIGNYEARRQAREDNCQKREAKLKLQRDELKAQITQLRTENQSLRQAANFKANTCLPKSPKRPVAQQFPPTSDAREGTVKGPQATGSGVQTNQGHLTSFDVLKTKFEEHAEGLQRQETMRKLTKLLPEDRAPLKTLAKHHKFTAHQTEKSRGSSRSPRRKALKPTLDIWTMDDEQDTPDNGMVSHQALPDDSSNEAGIVKLSKETDEALREISRNVIEEQHNSCERNLNLFPQKTPPSVNLKDHLETMSSKASSPELLVTSTGSVMRRMRERRSTINSPRPSMLSFVLSPEKEPRTDQPSAGLNLTDLQSTQTATNSLRRHTGTVSVTRRANSMVGVKPHTGITADRIHAAKLRLASKRKLQEGHKSGA